MIDEIGHFALVLALALALVQSVVPVWGARVRDDRLMAVAEPVAGVLFGLIAVSFAALTNAYVRSDFSLLNVAENSHSAMPLLFKFTGVWGNHEGSMLLWVLILVLFGALVALFGRGLPQTLRANVLGVQAWIVVAFLLFILLTSNPFTRLQPAPVEGQDLNPLLQDIGLAIHPPLLYLGYVGMSVVVLLRRRRLDRGAHRCGVGALGAAVDARGLDLPHPRHRDGLLLGLLRARLGWLVVLGPGRERLVHAVARRHGTDPFRSGDGEARRAEDLDGAARHPDLLAVPARHLPGPLGRAHLGPCLRDRSDARHLHPRHSRRLHRRLAHAVFAWRAQALKAGGLFAPVSREGALVLNNLFLTTACATVLVGTLYPLALEALTGEKISVGAPFFNMTFAPLMIPALLAVPFGPFLAWKRGDLLGVAQRLAFAAFVALATVAVCAWALGYDHILASLGIGLAAWLLMGAFWEPLWRATRGAKTLGNGMRRLVGLPRSSWGTTLGHMGLGVSLLGIVATSSFQTERIATVPVGGSVPLAGYTLTFDGLTRHAAGDYEAAVATFTLREGGRVVATLTPSKRTYATRQMTTSETGIVTLGLSRSTSPSATSAPTARSPCALTRSRSSPSSGSGRSSWRSVEPCPSVIAECA